MKKQKHLLITLTLIAVMAFGVTAASVYAEPAYPDSYCLTIGGADINPGGDASGNGWSYSGNTKTLELNGIGSGGETVSVIFKGFDLTVDLKNKNYVSGLGQEWETGDPPCKLTITGMGSLDVSVGCIKAGIIEIKSGTTNVAPTDANNGISGDSISINGDAKVTVTMPEYESDGIRAYEDFTLSDQANVTVAAGDEGAGVNSKQISIEGGSLNVTKGDTGIGYFGEGVSYGRLSITGGKVSINSSYEGIYTGTIGISGGNVFAASEKYYGIAADQAADISGKNTRVEAIGGTAPGIIAKAITISDPLTIITPKGGMIKESDSKQIIADESGQEARHVVICVGDYKITVQKPKNGTAKANKQRAKAGDTVKVTAAPAKGYTLDKMTYTNTAGKVTKIASSGSFKMPASDVTVKVTFKKIKKKPAAKPSGVLLATATAAGDKSIAVKWTKMKNVDGYDVFFAKCNIWHKDYPLKKAATIKGNKTFKWKKTSLKKGKPYKICVKAYVMKNGKKKYVKSSPVSHAYTSTGSKHYTNARSVTVDKDTLSIRKGKSAQLDPTVQKLKAKKQLMSKNHAPKLRYMSSKKQIATVSSSGRIKAVSKGTCDIYAYAHNGVYKKIKVTVK